MAAYRRAKSLDTLVAQINAAAPNRSKASDGWVGDLSHQARTSDHNPGPDGIVQAQDITHDRANGCDAQEIWDDLRRSPSPHFGYMIYNRRIWNPKEDAVGSNGRPYNGTNPHTKHIHISVHKDIDGTQPWPIIFGDTPPIKVAPMDPALTRPQLQRGVKNKAQVTGLQRQLKAMGFDPGKLDGDFGPKTEQAVKLFQIANKVVREDGTPSGIVGPYTWGALFPDASKPVTTSAPVAASSVPGAPIVMDAWYEPGHYPVVDAFGQAQAELVEGWRSKAYMDAGTPAQGFGHNAGSGVQPIPVIGGGEWSMEYGREVLRKDLDLQVHYLNAYVKVPLLQRHINALALDIFQLGPGNWKKDKVLALLNAKDYEGAAKWMRDRVDVPGLDRRRNRQADIFLGFQLKPW